MGIGSIVVDGSSGWWTIVGIGDVSLTGVVFVGVIDDRLRLSTGAGVTGDFGLDGVLVVGVDGDCSRLSNCSRREATPTPVGLGDNGVGDCSWIVVDGDWERGCRTGVCWDGFDIAPFEGVLAVVVEFRPGRVLIEGDDGKGSDLVNCGEETLLPDT